MFPRSKMLRWLADRRLPKIDFALGIDNKIKHVVSFLLVLLLLVVDETAGGGGCRGRWVSVGVGGWVSGSVGGCRGRWVGGWVLGWKMERRRRSRRFLRIVSVFVFLSLSLFFLVFIH